MGTHCQSSPWQTTLIISCLCRSAKMRPQEPLGIPLLSVNQLIPRTARTERERLVKFRSDLARCTVAVAWFQGQGKVDTRRHSRTASGGSGFVSFPPRLLFSPVSASLYASVPCSLSPTRFRAAVGDCLRSQTSSSISY